MWSWIFWVFENLKMSSELYLSSDTLASKAKLGNLIIGFLDLLFKTTRHLALCTTNCIIISTQCNELGEKGRRNLGRGSQKEIWRNSGSSFLAREQVAPKAAPAKVSSLTLVALRVDCSANAPAKTVAGPCEGNDPIFTEVVESKSSVNLGGGRCK